MTDTSLSILSPHQKEQIFENMSDGIMTVDRDGNITYMNSACEQIFDMTFSTLQNKSFEETFLTNRKNKVFNKLFFMTLKDSEPTPKTHVRYQMNGITKHLNVDISLVQKEENRDDDLEFPGMIILFDDITERYHLRQHQHDCAYIFAGQILCISLYLSLWSLLKFTLRLPLKTDFYTLMIEGMTFLLFLEILFCTSLSMKDIGLIPNFGRIKKNLIETVGIAIAVCLSLVILKLVLSLLGYQIKDYFIGGSTEGAYTYLFTAFIQEFLARGVIQTSVNSLMKVKYQKQFGVFLTSLLFALMHLPFGFIFLVSAFLLSLILGYLYERHGDLWGCAILHWSCGYLAMCLFF